MCFGPTASFTSGAVLAAAGTATLKNVRSRHELLFAAFPLLFAAQQTIEGFLWLGVKGGPLAPWTRPLTAAFLFFAYLVWPVFSPLAVYLLEPERKRKQILSVFIFMGIATAVYLAWFFFTYPHEVTVVHHSLRYHIKKFSTTNGVFYLGSTYVPYLLSSHKGLRVLGMLNIIFAAISRAIYWKTFDSVWCFFAALLSLGIFFFLRSRHQETGKIAAR